MPTARTATIQVHLRLAPDAYGILSDLADDQGLTLSQAANAIIVRVQSAGVLPSDHDGGAQG